MMSCFVKFCLAATLLLGSTTLLAETANSESLVQLEQAAHVCNDEHEAKRLAANDHLREMAKALVEFKATKYCFILQPSVLVRLLEHHGSYVKFSHDNKVLYTFSEHLQSAN
ncbi:MAG: hypothetical protein ACK4GU_11360 [Alishewanella aestuarii]